MAVTVSEVGLPPQQDLLRLSVEHGTSEKREMWMMGTSAECERGVMGREKRERGKSLRILFLPITPFGPAFLSRVAQISPKSDRTRLGTSQEVGYSGFSLKQS